MFKHVGAPTTSRRKRNAKGYDASSTDTLASLAARTRKELHAYLPQSRSPSLSGSSVEK